MMKKFKMIFLLIALTVILPSSLPASPWAEKSEYGDRTLGKFSFGLKNTLFGWGAMFVEAKQPKYKTEWEGFNVGIARSIIYTAAGMVQLVTFPIPVDFPDVGKGLHIPQAKDFAGAKAERDEEALTPKAE